ncbi:hypothetical protein BV25DRAFT_1826650 [Artomyces pyxidatus]|uniref:Uncharacterized protein n=1 Tax=Artomyces pyxidatus TaxID=48021 RepID=A0ACB8SZB1_9AGAM|nr:hypothetical protein BV25DRAFT_1826650 [Artomyces pyxidatus]
MTDSLLLLPTEILIGILLALEVGDILACTSTCKHLHAIIVDSLQLQYEIELYASGMLDGARGPHTLPVQERLDRIERYTAAWEQLLWTDRISLPHLAGCISPAAVSGDVVVLPQLDGTAVSMHVQQISSALRAVDEYYVAQSTPTSSPFFGIQLDSAQDLLVVSNGCGAILYPSSCYVA